MKSPSKNDRDKLSLTGVHDRSPVAEKIALFWSLFRGRDDVYPRRFESKNTGKTGYAPACGNEWVRGICEKPRIKCGDCPHRAFLPVTDEVIRWHLSGKDKSGQDFVAGIYPMLADESCYFLAMDFDKESWHEDVLAVMETCRILHIPAALERSRSGNGGHVWLFFAEAVAATLARKLGSFILTETMERRPELGLTSYDRLFPNQDTMPKGGFGNLIALPMQKGPRANGHSLFVDDTFTPYPDPWAFLSSIGRLSRERLEAIVQDAEKRSRVTGVRFALSPDDEPEPWNAPPSRRHHEPPITDPLPKEIEIVLGDLIYLTKSTLPPPLRNRLLRLAAFQNPEFYRAQAMRLSTHEKPRIIACAEDLPTHIGLPRGCMDDLLSLCSELKIKPIIRDERVAGNPVDVTFTGILRPDQEAAAAAMLAQYAGRLHRLHDGKREVRIHDYADLDIPMLARMFDKRCAGYEAVGYTILLPASALPGWPTEVPLPIDPVWKKDYTASVRRLIRDGVDAPLANLFVGVTHLPTDQARARSASEAFLFQRLQSLAETNGLFQLNRKLPIPFDGWSEMEVDLFCAKLKLVIEIDGPQHLSDPIAYRRDRRKDALLQENGCHVLRFLAEDLGKHLDATLDGIHRAIIHLRRKR